MHRILLLGAGKSATVLIDYLLQHASAENWHITIADANLDAALTRLGTSTNGTAVSFDIREETACRTHISRADLIISLLPPELHAVPAVICGELGKHFLTASYLDDRIRKLDEQVREKGVLFLTEMGLDPGIDHMSAMQIIDSIRGKGGRIESFLSHCGGLVAPESDDNPWHYKVSWNPRNIIRAGSAGAVYKEKGILIRKEYQQVFADCPELNLEGLPSLSWYPNRDSLAYIPLYGLEEAHTFIRTTLRYTPFCSAWDKLVKAGLTNDQDIIQTGSVSYAGFSRTLFELCKSDELEPFQFLGLLDERIIPGLPRSSAAILQELVEDKLKLKAGDKDMIVMVHEFVFEEEGKKYYLNSQLVVKGEDSVRTAMAKTVGLPLGIAAKLVLQGKLNLSGVHIPTSSAIYEPVLAELKTIGVEFQERRNLMV